jgi:beta-lactamase superfamily II metal-dependent hydrolase
LLEIWVLNANHGDSIVVRHVSGEREFTGVIDSNRVENSAVPAIGLLRRLGVERLDFVALTHPHADHYMGLHEILGAYAGKISCFYTCPLAGDIQHRRKRLCEMYIQCAKQSDSEFARNAAADFVRLIVEADKQTKAGVLSWTEITGPDNVIHVDRPSGLQISFVLPLKKYKGEYFQLLDQGALPVLESSRVNDLSLAVRIEYAGHEFLLGGDASHRSWMDHKREFMRQGRGLRAIASKLPHHGSRDDCSDAVLEYIFESSEMVNQRYAVISANGRSHPSPATLGALKDRNVFPYCTNLAKMCGSKIRAMFTSDTASPETVRFVNAMDPEPRAALLSACQGDICVRVSATGEVSVQSQHSNACHLRGDLDGLPVIS